MQLIFKIERFVSNVVFLRGNTSWLGIALHMLMTAGYIKYQLKMCCAFLVEEF